MMGRWASWPVCALLLVCALVPAVAWARPADSDGTARRGWEDRSAFERWYWQQRALPSADVPAEACRQAVVNESLRAPREAASGVAWQPVGPAPIRNMTMFGDGTITGSGRTLTVAVHPTDHDLILVGTAQGGIWRSTDGGRHYLPVADSMPSLAIKVIRFCLSDPDIVYAGSGEPHSKTSIFGMGVYKSTDAGLTWAALPDHGGGWDFRYVAISGLRVHPANSDILYVTTANVLPDRVNLNQPPPDRPLTGVYKSVDGGVSWNLLLPATDYRRYMYPIYDPYLSSGVGFMDLEMFQANPKILFVSEYSGGIYRSIDGGTNWTRVTPVKNPDAGAAMGATLPAYPRGFNWFDCDAATFRRCAVIPHPRTVPEFNRIEMGLAQRGDGITTDFRTMVLYAGYGVVLQLDRDDDGAFDAGVDVRSPEGLLFKSTDGGTTWAWLGDWLDGVPHYCDVCGDEGQMDCLYDNTVEVNPLDADDVVIGGNANYSPLFPDPVPAPIRMLELPWSGEVYRSVDGGTSWANTTPACDQYVPDTDEPPVHGLPRYKCAELAGDNVIHPDVHGATFVPGEPRFYAYGDGGVYECRLKGHGAQTTYAWKPLNNGLSTLQIFHFGSHPSKPDTILAAMQDNASAYWNGTLWDAWDALGGDGTVGAFDPKSPNYVYYGQQYELYRHDAGGSKSAEGWKHIVPSRIGDDTSFPFVMILEIDPVRTNNIYVASTTAVYRSTDRGNHWLPKLNTQAFKGQPTTISVSPKNGNLVWVGTSEGRVHLFDLQQNTMSNRTGTNMPNRWVSKIEASPNEEGGAIVVFSGYDASSANTFAGGNGNVGKVFRTTDLGRRWTDVSGNLTGKKGLDLPVSTVVIDPADEDRMWIGTDVGVYRTTNGGGSWESYRGNMPIVAVMALEYNVNTGYLMAGTFGRSLWRMRVGK